MASQSLGTAVLELRTDDSSFSSGLASAEKLAVGFAGAIAAAAATAAAAVTAIGIASIGMAREFESSFAGVRKTIDATDAEFAEIERGLRELALQIPVNVNELNSIAEAAGQLGIQKDALLGFTETMANLGVATNLTAEQAAVSMAQIATVTKLPTDQFENLGSALVDLGNNFATNEAKILDFSGRIAGAGATVDLTTAQIFGIATAFSSVGVGAEAGGTAVQKVLLEMLTAVETGSDTLETFAETAGMTGEQFAAAFRDDAGVAFSDFVTGLGEQGTAAISTLTELGLQDQRLISSFLRVAAAGDVVTEAMETSTAAFAENTALAKEAAQRYATFDSQMTLTGNALRELGISIGAELLPALSDMLGIIRKIATDETFVEFIKLAAETVGFLLEIIVETVRIIGTEFRDAMRTHAQAWLDVAVAMDKLPGIFKVLIPNFDALQVSALSIADTFTDLSGAGGDVADTLGFIVDTTGVVVPEFEELIDVTEELEEEIVDANIAFREFMAEMAKGAAATMKKHEQQIVAIAGEYEELAVDVLPEVVEELGVVADAAVESANRIIEAFQDAADTMRAIWEDVAADMAFVLVDGLISGFDDIEQAFGDILGQAGAQVGANLGKRFGPIGEAVGAKLGDAIGEGLGKALGSLFGGKDRVGDALKKFGLEVSDALKDIIKQTSEDLATEAETALRVHLGDIIREVGIDSAESLATFVNLAELLLFDLERALLSSEETVVALDDALGELLENFVAAGGGLSELEGIADIFGHTLGSVRDGLLSADEATQLWNDNFGEFIDLAVEFGEEGLKMIEDLVRGAEEAGLSLEVVAERLSATMAEALDIFSQRQALLVRESTNLVGAIEALLMAGGGGVRQLEFAATSVLQAFDAMIAGGIPLSQVISTLETSLGLIGDEAARIGAEVPPEFARLGEVLEILADDQLQGAIFRLEQIEAAANAAGNMGLLTAEQFDFFGDRIDGTFAKLIDGGLTGEEALAALAPQLQELQDLSQEYGFVVDNNTQALLDQAMAQGLLQDKGLTMEDILIRGFDRMLEGINALIVALGGIPLIFESIGKSVDQLVEDVSDIQVNIDVNFDVEDLDIPGFAHGTGGFQDFGRGAPAILHGREQIVTHAQGVGIAGMVRQAIRDAGGQSSDSDLRQFMHERIRQERNAHRERKKHINATHNVAAEVKKGSNNRPSAFRTAGPPGTVC